MEKRYHVVGWFLNDEHTCACGKTAGYLLQVDDNHPEAVCGDCIPDEADDPIRDAFVRAVEAERAKKPS